MKNIGIIGCGGMGITHLLSLKALAATQDINVTAMADVRRSALEKALTIWPGADCYLEGMQLLEEASLDIVLICLPSYLHTAYAARAMEKKLDVFLEKPVCLSEEDCSLLTRLQKTTGSRVLVGQVVRMMDEYRYLKALVEQQTYGKLRSLVMWRLSGLVDWGYENWFRDAARSGSVILDLHIHDVDFLRYLLGEPDEISVSSRKNSQDMPEQIMTQYRFGEVIASAEAVWDNPKGFPFEAGYHACFENATILFNSNSPDKIVEFLADGERHIPVLEKEYQATNSGSDINISELGPYYNEMKYFIDCLSQNREIITAPLSEGIASVQLCLKELALAMGTPYKK
jgi:Predicted dehydrogenases and related proteins